MSFRQYGGLGHSSTHNFVNSKYNNVGHLSISASLGQPNTSLTCETESISVQGDITATGTITAAQFITSSDHRIKTFVQSLTPNDTVDALRPVQYVNTLTGQHDMGFIAHEVGEVYPHIVQGTKDGDELQGVQYTSIIALLVHEIQQLKRRIKQLEDDTTNAKNENK